MRSKFNNGQWTQARFHSFVKSALRSASRKWPVRNECLNESKTEKKINESSGRIAQHYLCAKCGKDYPLKQVNVDHIEPIVPNSGFTTWDEIVDRMYCEKENLQILCLTCHKAKTQQEKEQRKLHGS